MLKQLNYPTRFRTFCDLVILQEGKETMTDRLQKKYGITTFEKIDPSHTVFSIGFNEKDNVLYGWSHRAISSFGIGSTCKLGDCHYQASNEQEFKQQVEKWYSEPDYLNINIREGQNDDRKGLWIKYNIRSNKELSTVETFEPYPLKWGKGEWTAKTIEDAKQMAVDFSNAVS